MAFDNNIENPTSLITVTVYDIEQAKLVEPESGLRKPPYGFCFPLNLHLHYRRLPPIGVGVVPDASRFGREISRSG